MTLGIVIMLSVAFSSCHAEFPYAECHYAEYHYAECRGTSNLVTTRTKSKL